MKKMKEFFEKQPILEPLAYYTTILLGIVIIFTGLYITGGIIASAGVAIIIFSNYRENKH